jgi:hypothetical protein
VKRDSKPEAWVRPEPRCPWPAGDAEAAEVVRRAGRVARSAILLGMKVARAVLDVGIRRMERPEPDDKPREEHSVEKIDIS